MLKQDFKALLVAAMSTTLTMAISVSAMLIQTQLLVAKELKDQVVWSHRRAEDKGSSNLDMEEVEMDLTQAHLAEVVVDLDDE